MKRCLLLFALLACACCSFCQGNDSLGKLKDHYLRESRWQIPVGIVMAGVGTGMFFYAFAKVTSSVLSVLTLQPEDPGKNVGTIGIVGDVLALSGIPVLVIGEINRGRAAHLKLDMQKAAALLPASRVSSIFQPALTLTFDLSKRKRRN